MGWPRGGSRSDNRDARVVFDFATTDVDCNAAGLFVTVGSWRKVGDAAPCSVAYNDSLRFGLCHPPERRQTRECYQNPEI
jgi:hypothetical protein